MKIEEIKGYLGTGVKAEYREYLNNEKTDLGAICIVEITGLDFQKKKILIRDGYVTEMDSIKLILHPLSDLTKYCEDLGFVPIEELYKIEWNGTHHLSENNKYYTVEGGLFTKCSHNSTVMETNVNIKYPLNNNYWKIQKLYEWHFNIHGIEAIDINTL